MLVSVSVLYVQQAIAQKYLHKDFEAVKLTPQVSLMCNECHKGEGVAINHDADWVRGHRLVAVKPNKNCDQCHNQAFCADCHYGGGIDASLSTQNYQHDYIPKSHRSDWLEIHPIKSIDNPQSCYRCHNQQYCSQCHSKFKGPSLQFLSHRRQFKDIKLTSVGPNHALFTPSQCQTCHPGGMVPAHTWSDDHAREARRNLQSCQTCHGDGDVCMTCHSARTGLKINPHPRNWGSIKGNFKDKSNGRSCIRCHDNF